MKPIFTIFIFALFLSGNSIFANAAERFYLVDIAGPDDHQVHMTCDPKERCFLSLPFRNSHIDVAIKFQDDNAIFQFMHERVYLHTTSIGSAVAELSLRQLPIRSDIELYHKNYRDESLRDLLQSPVVHVGVPLGTISVKITDTSAHTARRAR